jgi:hypothetical protein
MTKTMLRTVVLAPLLIAIQAGCGKDWQSGETPGSDAALAGQTGGAGGVRPPLGTGGEPASTMGAGGAAGLGGVEGSGGKSVTTGAGGAGGGIPVGADAADAPTAPSDAAIVTADVAPDAPATTSYVISLAPVRKLDLVFMIDNSPSMAPKVKKMNAQFPKLIAALKDPNDGTYPDLRVALVDSDLGTGGQYTSGSCGPNASNGQNPYGDLGTFQMRGKDGTKSKGTDCGMSDDNALWIEYANGAPVNYNGGADAINSVFACLATNLGTTGCGEEHSLQAYEFAFFANDYHPDPQKAFLSTRPEAYLGLVFLSDEDDCSAATNDGMFGDKPETRGESASLRCATRGHQCGGHNLADWGPMYPTTERFQADLASCAARTDSCPNNIDGVTGTDTTGPTSCTPLRSIKTLADKIKSLKGEQANEKILVAGIFGWPLAGSSPEPYKIDLIPNPNSADTTHPQVFDYWPVCYDPDHKPQTAGAYDADAWGWGAQGGLRMSAFIDEFGANGTKYSICERDFTGAMQGFGRALAKRLTNLCVPADIQGRKCTARYRSRTVDAGAVGHVDSDKSLPMCPAGATSTDVDCYLLVPNPDLCPDAQLLVQVLRTPAEIAVGPLPDGTELNITCE